MRPMLDSSQKLVGQRALVTGGTGFVGSRLIGHLLTAGWEVHMLVRADAERSVRPPRGVLIHPYRGKTVDVVAATERSKPDVVFHLASLFLAQHTPDQVASLIEANVLLGTQLLEGMSKTGVTSLVRRALHGNTTTVTSFIRLTSTRQQSRPSKIFSLTTQMRPVSGPLPSLFDTYGPGDTRKAPSPAAGLPGNGSGVANVPR